MTDAELKRANALRRRIEAITIMLEQGPMDDFPIPQEMLDRHEKEKREYLEDELPRLKAEYEAI